MADEGMANCIDIILAIILPPLGVFLSRALRPGVQWQRKPRRWPLVPRPRRLRPSNLVTAAGDRPFLRRERVGPLSGGLSFLLG